MWTKDDAGIVLYAAERLATRPDKTEPEWQLLRELESQARGMLGIYG